MGSKESKPKSPEKPKKRGCGGGDPAKPAAAPAQKKFNTRPAKLDWHCLDTTVFSGKDALKNIDTIETLYKYNLSIKERNLTIGDNLKTD